MYRIWVFYGDGRYGFTYAESWHGLLQTLDMAWQLFESTFDKYMVRREED